MKKWTRLILMSLLAAGGFASTGCKTTAEPGNESARPWNAPKGWEGGIPGFLYNDRRY